jgi:hypothetical protein
MGLLLRSWAFLEDGAHLGVVVLGLMGRDGGEEVFVVLPIGVVVALVLGR